MYVSNKFLDKREMSFNVSSSLTAASGFNKSFILTLWYEAILLSVEISGSLNPFSQPA